MELEVVHNRIFEIRGSRVILDIHLAELYDTQTRVLKQAVRRNLNRFPPDFMLMLTQQEVEVIIAQKVISNKQMLGGAFPFAFTEQGVAMLSSVLQSEKAIQVNIAVMRAFVLLREAAFHYKGLRDRIDQLEANYDEKFADIYQVLDYLLNPPVTRRPIGFKSYDTDINDKPE